MRETFSAVLFYLYTDTVPESIVHRNCMPLIELANRFCLSRLIALVETKIIEELESSPHESESNSIVLRLLEPCQLHNADQLSDYCLYRISVHYNDICHVHSKLLRALQPENQAYLNRNRWPPVWFLKEFDYYERCVREQQWKHSNKPRRKHHLRRITQSICGCLPELDIDDNPKQINTNPPYPGLRH